MQRWGQELARWPRRHGDVGPLLVCECGHASPLRDLAGRPGARRLVCRACGGTLLDARQELARADRWAAVRAVPRGA